MPYSIRLVALKIRARIVRRVLVVPVCFITGKTAPRDEEKVACGKPTVRSCVKRRYRFAIGVYLLHIKHDDESNENQNCVPLRR